MSRVVSVPQRRLQLYRTGVNALHGLGSHQPWVYLCPICTTGYGWAALVDGELTEEHVPPSAVGGEAICLTCKPCNNRAGTALEYHLEKRSSAERFVAAVRGQEDIESHPAILQIEEKQQRVSVTASPEEGVIVEGLPDLNPPGTAERFRDLMEELTGSEKEEGPKLRLSSLDRYHPWRVMVAVLKAAFLAAFAKLGYRYALHPALRIVREQIQHPEQQLISVFHGRFREGEDVIGMWHVREPIEALFVRIHTDFVLLPALAESDGFYERLAEHVEEVLESRGWPLRWPTCMHMALDE